MESIYIYSGGESLVGKSGVGQAIRQQRECLRRSGVATTDRWTRGTAAVHVNTVLPDSVLAALGAKLRGRKVVYYGHSTMEDFKGSFKGSNLLAPLFRRWITFCYGLGDVVLTPTDYSKRLLESYGLKKPVYNISNGVDVDFFAPDPAKREAFRARYGLQEGEKAVVSVGHTIARKGLPEVRLDRPAADPPRNCGGDGTCAGKRRVPRLCWTGGTAGGILRGGRVCIPEP